MQTYANLGEMLLRRPVMGRTVKVNNKMAKAKAKPLQKAPNPAAGKVSSLGSMAQVRGPLGR